MILFKLATGFFATYILFASIFIIPAYLPESNAQVPIERMPSYNKSSKYVQDFSIPILDADLRGISVDKQGDVWFYMANASTIGRFSVPENKFREYEVTAPTVSSEAVIRLAGGQITFDKDGNVWFTDARANAIGRLDPISAEIKMFPIPTKDSGPLGITMDKKGQVWFTEILGDRIGRLDTARGLMDEFLLDKNSGPALITSDSNGNIWFTLAYVGGIAMLEPEKVSAGTGNGITQYALDGFFSPFGLAVSDDTIWVSDHGGSKIGRFLPSSGSLTLYWTSSVKELPVREFPDTLPSQLLLDSKGRLWFAEHVGNRIGKLDPSRNLITEYEVPTRPLTITLWIAMAPDGNVWFTEWASNKIGFVNASTPAPFTITTSKNVEVIQPGGSVQNDVFVTWHNNQSLNIALGIEGMTDAGPGHLEPTFSNPTLISVNTRKTSLMLSADESIKQGTYSIMVRASADMVSQLTMLTILVQQSPSQVLESEKPSLSFAQYVQFIAMGVLIAIGFLIFYRRKAAKGSKTG